MPISLFHVQKAGKICRSWSAAWANPGKIAGTDPQSQRSILIFKTLYYINIYNKNTVNIKGELIFKWNYFLLGFGLEALEKER